MQSLHTAPPSAHRVERTPASHTFQTSSSSSGERSPSLQEAAAPGAPSGTANPSSGRPGSFYLPIDVSSRFGARLRELRRERNMTQLRMATDFGIDRSFISDVERGRKSISLPMLEVIALGMKMSLSDLLQNI